jgi:hypothetical protein
LNLKKMGKMCPKIATVEHTYKPILLPANENGVPSINQPKRAGITPFNASSVRVRRIGAPFPSKRPQASSSARSANSAST